MLKAARNTGRFFCLCPAYHQFVLFLGHVSFIYKTQTAIAQAYKPFCYLQ